jgi:uncharacterized membrane protein
MMHLAFHPFFASFPMAVFASAVLLEVLGCRYHQLRPAVFVLLLVAALSITAAFLTGYFASYYAEQSFTVSEDLIGDHHRLGKVALVLLWLTPALKLVHANASHGKAFFASAYIFCLVASIISLACTGYWGAWLVFGAGAGVFAH